MPGVASARRATGKENSVANPVRALIDRMKRYRDNQRSKEAAALKRQQEERDRSRKTAGDHVGGGFKGGY
jgi:hypothetical protein